MKQDNKAKNKQNKQEHREEMWEYGVMLISASVFIFSFFI